MRDADGDGERLAALLEVKLGIRYVTRRGKKAASPRPLTAVARELSRPCRPNGTWPTVLGSSAAIVAPNPWAPRQTHAGALMPDPTPGPTELPRAALTSAGVTSAHSWAAVKPAGVEV